MSGIIGKEQILEEAKIQASFKNLEGYIQGAIDKLDLLAKEAAKANTALGGGLADAVKANNKSKKSADELGAAQKDLSEAAQRLIDIEAKRIAKLKASAEAEARIIAMLKEEGLTWDKVRAKMGDYMTVAGSMGAAHKKMGVDWKAYKDAVVGGAKEIAGAVKEAARANKAEAGSIKELENQLKKNKAEYKALSKEARKLHGDELKDIQAKIVKLDEYNKKFRKGITDAREKAAEEKRISQQKIRDDNKAINDADKLWKKQNKVTNSPDNSIQRLGNQNKVAEFQINKYNSAKPEDAAAIDNLNKKINENNEAIRKLIETKNKLTKAENEAAAAAKKANNDRIAANRTIVEIQEASKGSIAALNADTKLRKQRIKNLNADNAEELALMRENYQAINSNNEKKKQIREKERADIAATRKAERDSAAASKLNAQEEKLKLAIQTQAVGSIRRLQAENQLSAFTIKNKLNPAIAAERAEILRLNQVIGTNKDVIAKMQREQVTAWGRVTSAVFQHLAAYVGFQQLINIAQNIFKTTKELDSLNYAINAVITNQDDLAKSQEFLSRITSSFGAELVSTTERYIKFYAAAKQSKVPLQDTQDIFEAVTKVSATLGLKTDELTGIYLALEQMMSKGCHAKGTKVLMYDRAIKLIEDIVIGDLLMGDDYTPREVLALANGEDEMYDIIPDGVEKFNVNVNHIIPLRNKITRVVDNIKIYEILNTYNDYQVIHKELGYLDFKLTYTGIGEYFGVKISNNNIFLLQNLVYQHNTVTTEELRRQLGERVPGAVAILARSMGVTTAKLSDMMKKGEVFAAEVLPNFAKELERTFGVENIERIDTMQTSLSRITLAWQSFVKQIEGSKMFTGILNKISEFITFYTNAMDDSFESYQKQNALINDTTKGIDKLIGRYEALTIKVTLTKEEQDELNSITQRLAASFGGQSGVVTQFNAYGDALKIDVGLIRAIITETRGMTDEMKKSAIEKETYKLGALNSEYERYQKMLKTGKNNGSPILSSTLETMPAKIKEIGIQIKATEARIGVLNGVKPKSNNAEIIPFDVEKFEKEVDAIKETYISLNKAIEGGAEKKEQDYLVSKSNVLKKGFKTEKEYLNNLLVEYKDNIDARIVIFNRLAEIEKKESKGGGTKGKKPNIKDPKDFTVDLMEDEQNANKEMLAQIEKDRKEAVKKIEKDQRDLTDQTIADSLAFADEEKLSAQEVALEKIKAARGSKDAIEDIQHELTMFMIDEDIAAQQRILDTKYLEVDAYADASERIRRLRLQRGEEELTDEERLQAKKDAIRNETMQSVNAVLQEGLTFSKQIYSNQAERAQEAYDAEMKAAGDSVEAQIVAKRKFEEEDKKIKRRQAIADKLQAIFNAGLNLAMAIGTTWKNPLLAGLNIAAASIGLATAVAIPIPAYFKGTDNAPETFIAGERGSEAIIKPDGGVMLTPDKATLFSDKSFIGSKILPADRTQAMLNSYAVNGGSQVFVDMSQTNSTLKSIDKTLKNSPETRFVNAQGKTVIKKGNTTTILV